MEKERLAAFSDGVIAILLTIMVLELKRPLSPDWAGLREVLPELCSYLLSFIYVAIYWNNHHHMLQTVKHIDGKVMWANMHLLFWLSLIPFTTSWMSEYYSNVAPSAVYGFVLLMAAIAYYILQNTIVCLQGKDSVLAKAIGSDLKGKISPILYMTGILLALLSPRLSQAIYVGTALLWLAPDRRIEEKLTPKS